jgi:tetratricopeptide (TPR) repeat protein
MSIFLESKVQWYSRGLSLTSQGKGNNKGELLRRQGKYEEAIQSFDKALEINPQHYGAWNNRGLRSGVLVHLTERACRLRKTPYTSQEAVNSN